MKVYNPKNLNVFIRLVSLLMVAGILFTACAYSREMLNGIHNAKTSWFFWVTGILLIILSLNVFTNSFLLKFNLPDVLVCSFLIYTIINGALHDELFLSQKNMEAAGLLSFYFFSKSVYTDRKGLPVIFIVLLLLTALQIGTAFLQWADLMNSFNYNFRITGSFFNPAPFAIFLSVLLVYCLAGLFLHENKRIRIVCHVLFLAGIPVILIILSRSAALGLLSGIIFLSEIRFGILKNLVKRTSLIIKGFTSLLILLVIVFVCLKLYDIRRDSADGRLHVWKLSLNMIQDHPVSGVGQGNFAARFLKYQSEYFHTRPERMDTEGKLADYVVFAFNDILQISAELGLPGLAFLFLLILIIIKCAFKLIKDKKTVGASYMVFGSLAALLVIMISGLFSYPLTQLPLKIMFYNSLAVLSASYGHLYVTKEPGLIFKQIKRWVVAPLCCLIGIYFSGQAFTMYNAYKEWKEIAVMGYEGEDIKELDKYKSLLQQDPGFIIATGGHHLLTSEYSEAIHILENAKQVSSDPQLYYLLADAYIAVKNYPMAEKQYKFLSYALPGLLRPKYKLAMLYYDTGQSIKWRKQADEVILFKPKIRSELTDNMLKEIKKLYNK